LTGKKQKKTIAPAKQNQAALMSKCPKCGSFLTDIKQLSEVSSLGLALRGKCPKCGAWVWCEDLWKKTKFIDKTHPRATRERSKPRKKRGYTRTPSEAKTAPRTPPASAIIVEIQNYAE